MNERPKLKEIVALLTDVPAAKVLRGQVGTIKRDASLFCNHSGTNRKKGRRHHFF